MRSYLGLIIVGILAVFLLFNIFSNDNGTQRGMSGSDNYQENTYKDLPSEPDKSEILDTISSSNASSISTLIENGFPLLDTVKTDKGISKIYVTQKLTLKEAADALADKIEPEETSKKQDDKQVLVYPDHFVILQKSQEQQDVVFIELASDQFVRNNYSPGFFNGLMTYYILNRALGSDNWYNKRKSACKAQGNCYGGYVQSGRFNSGTTGSFRGSSQRGGGPGAGK